MIYQIIQSLTILNLWPLKSQEVDPRYFSENYANLIKLLDSSEHLSPKKLNQSILVGCINNKFNWSTIRFLVLEDFKRQDGQLTCRLCGKGNLISSGRNGRADLATIEHIVPKSAGGLKFNPINMTITCCKCNNARKVTPIVKINHWKYELQSN